MQSEGERLKEETTIAVSLAYNQNTFDVEVFGKKSKYKDGEVEKSINS